MQNIHTKVDIPLNKGTKAKHSYKYHHYPHVTLLVQISRTISCHLSLSSIAFGRSARQHLVSVLSCCR